MNRVLRQVEMDLLLKGLAANEDIDTIAEERPAEIDAAVPAFPGQKRFNVRSCMPVVESVNDRFAQLCSNGLSNALRRQVELNPFSIVTTRFGDFMRSLPIPTSINIFLFRMDPLCGNAIVMVDSRLVFSMVENILGGGSCQSGAEGRKFSPTEQAVADRIVRIALDSMEKAWRTVHEGNLELVRSEIDPQFATIVAPDDVVMIVSFEVRLNASLGSITFCLPYATMERMMPDHAEADRFRGRILETPVEVRVMFDYATFSQTLPLQMQIGDVTSLATDIDALHTCTVVNVDRH